MANWEPLRELLREVPDTRTFTWAELEALVGPLPPSAYRHSAYWKGSRSGWPGFTTTNVAPGQSVTFVRRSKREPAPVPRPRPAAPRPADARMDVILIGCVKSKLTRAAPARDLYTSALFRGGRRYAEQAGVPWFILSAEHGLVPPDQVLEPYELHLGSTSASYRARWGAAVVERLDNELGGLSGRTIEIHAGAPYTDAVRDRLLQAGANLLEPLAGLSLGKRLQWYATSQTDKPTEETADLIARLLASDTAETPAEFLAGNGISVRIPGLYSWWVDESGAKDLTAGLGYLVEPGLIYAGLAGATRSRSRRPSTNTLWGRINGMHLGGRHKFSTFRLTLGSILAEARHETAIDEAALTAWMHQHLRVITAPVTDADTLDDQESAILDALDPPLNLAKMAKNDLRLRLSELRRSFGSRT